MDLRGHGNSFQRKEETTPTENEASSFQDCAQDVHHTLVDFDKEKAPSTNVLVGHSFGGRVALEYAASFVDSGNPTIDAKVILKW